jgi:ribosomal protein L11 methylase PrmA
MKPESHLLISGFLISDTAYLLDIAAKNYLKPLNRKEKNGWVCISLAKENL